MYTLTDMNLKPSIPQKGMKYLVESVPHGHLPTTLQLDHWHEKELDDSNWADGSLPFGFNVQCEQQLASRWPGFLTSAETEWSTEDPSHVGHLFIRDTIFVPPAIKSTIDAASTLRFQYLIDGDLLDVKLNGVSQLKSPRVYDGCSSMGKFRYVTLDKNLIIGGDQGNVLAIHAVGKPQQRYLNYRVQVIVCESECSECVS
eukprot:CAMPEP_0185829900 /NCGR_PEP_ID=MMETSP1353-20130828/515_1 /TAXON_ID=1077150 /ORGANISM="Erythrolobus australicus, Strain CCMP3124" /LENGTH=200 /DNA_ID=CAMNT_0028527741 /DNA_START=413 /DNA_END=1015 /DNA_ORIENTATION=-